MDGKMDAKNPGTNFLKDPELPQIGDIISGCCLENIIHVGIMAILYRGNSRSYDQDCIVKICRPSSSMAYRRAFVLKRNLHARLEFPEIITINTGGYWNERLPYSLTPFFEGRTLQTTIETSEPLPQLVSLAIIKIIGTALQHACNKIVESGWAGYLYRCIWSITTENILITKTGDLKILDIGLEQFFDDRLPVNVKWEELPPPQYSSNVDISTIIYSTGMLLLTMLYGSQNVLSAVSEVKALHDKNSKGKDVNHIINKCISEKLGSGYNDFDEILEDIDICLKKHSTASAREIIKAWFLNGNLQKKKINPIYAKKKVS
jgi:hypothetical protein